VVGGGGGGGGGVGEGASVDPLTRYSESLAEYTVSWQGPSGFFVGCCLLP
jgi:hypothetical protein